jgi:hypothetical protein
MGAVLMGMRTKVAKETTTIHLAVLSINMQAIVTIMGTTLILGE